jgi:lambda repressor-like predicted transcriptional regulator
MAVKRSKRDLQQTLDLKGWTVSDLAIEAGVSRQTIYHILAGTGPRGSYESTVRAIADALEMSRDRALDMIVLSRARARR